MTAEVNSEIESVRRTVASQQRERHASGLCCDHYSCQSLVDGLSFRVIPYISQRDGCGYGIEFELVAEDGSVMIKAFDEGFMEADGVPTGHVSNHDWREKRESIIV